MDEQRLKKIERAPIKAKNNVTLAREAQSSEKGGKEKVNLFIEGMGVPLKNCYHNKSYEKERPISSAYPVINTDLARDNLENDLTSSDLQDL